MPLEFRLTNTLLLTWLAGAILALYGWLAVWVTQRGRLAIRAACLVAALAMLRLADTDDLLLLLVADVVTIIFVILLGRSWMRRNDGAIDQSRPDAESKRQGLTFSLAEALVAMFLIAVICALTTQLSRASWSRLFMLGGVLSTPSLVAAFIVAGQGRWWLKVGLALLTVPAVFVFVVWLSYPESDQSRFENWITHHHWPQIVCGGVLLNMVLLAAWMILRKNWKTTSTAKNDSSVGIGQRLKRIRPMLPALLIGSLTLLPPVAMVLRLLYRAPIPVEPQLSENHWQEIDNIGNGFPLEDHEAGKSFQPANLPALHDQYARDLQKLHQLLSLPARKGVDYAKFEPFQYRANGHFRSEGLLNAMFELELARGDIDSALNYVVDGFKLGQATAMGGALNELAQGTWIEMTVGVENSIRLRDKLDTDQCRRLIMVMNELDREWEDWQLIVRRQRAFEDRVLNNWTMRLDLFLDELTGRTRIERAKRQTELNSHRARLRMLTCSLAIRLYELEHGAPPSELSELTPDFLDDLPLDPFNGEPFVYRRSDKGFQIYSVGPDGRDDGGQNPRRGYEPLDVLFKPVWR